MKKRKLLASCVIIIIMLLTGCGKKEITEIYLQTEELSLGIGESATVTYTHFPTDASTEGITYTSINPEIATVDNSGLVVGISSGKTRIVVASESGITAACSVLVKSPSAIEQLNEHETRFFEFLIDNVLPDFYNASAARIRVIYGKNENYMTALPFEIEGTNKAGGTIFKFYSINFEEGKCYDFTEAYAFVKGGAVLDSSIMDVSKINLALEEYWENKGM